jgi:hypothetical protein
MFPWQRRSNLRLRTVCNALDASSNRWRRHTRPSTSTGGRRGSARAGEPVPAAAANLRALTRTRTRPARKRCNLKGIEEQRGAEGPLPALSLLTLLGCRSDTKAECAKKAINLKSAIFLLFVTTAFGQFSGPAILSRGEAPTALNTPMVSFRPFADIQGTYDGGLAGVSLANDGSIKNEGSAGLRANWGISGTHSWRHTKLGLDYRSTLAHYQLSRYDTFDQALLFGITQQLSRRAVLTLRESAGSFSRNFQLPGLSQTVPFDPISSHIPTVDYFDDRTYYADTQVDLAFQASSRLTYDVGADAFVTRRRASALSGVVGATARGDVEYRLTRRTSIGAMYNFGHYDFTKTNGGTDQHSFNGTYSNRLTRNTEISAYAGVVRVESKFIQSTAIDPVIGALLGIRSAAQIVHKISWDPNLSARLSRRYHHGVVYVSGGHTVTPGNGLFLTSLSTSVQGGYTYTGLRTWAVTTSASYHDSNAVGAIAGNYRTVTASSTVTRQVSRSTHLVFEAGMRKYDSADFSGYNRMVFFCRGGIGFTPGDLPFRLW